MAAVLYGVGIRLEEQPELLFHLGGVDHAELVGGAAEVSPAPRADAKHRKVLADVDVGALFGIEVASGATPKPRRRARKRAMSPSAPQAR